MGVLWKYWRNFVDILKRVWVVCVKNILLAFEGKIREGKIKGKL